MEAMEKNRPIAVEQETTKLKKRFYAPHASSQRFSPGTPGAWVNPVFPKELV